MTTTKQHRWFENAGYSLIELMVAMLVSTLVVGAVLSMLVSIEEIQRDSQQMIDSQQAARISLDQVQRDLQMAGVGIAWLVAPMPLVVPEVGGGFTVRHNQSGVRASLVVDMGGTGADLRVDDAAGFAPGMGIAVYDNAGALSFVTVTGVNLGADRISHDGTTKIFTVADGTAVARIETITYSVDGQDRLLRQVNAEAPEPLAGNVAAFNVTYWNNSTPSAVFNPATVAQQLLIQTIQVALTVETEDPQLNAVNERQRTLTTQVTPRAIILS